MGKGAGQVVDVLEATGGTLTLQDLADRTGSKRPRDLKRRTLPRLVEAGVVVVEAGVVALAGDWRESLEVERERAGENAAYRRDADRYQREREAYRRRDETSPEAISPPLRALCELERVGVEEKDGETAPDRPDGDPKPPVEGRMGKIAVGTHNTSEGVFSGGGYGPAATPDRTGGTQERSKEREMQEYEQAEEGGETGDSGAQERGTLREWVLLDLVEAGRVERSGVGDSARYQLSADERDAELMRRFSAGEGRGHDGD
jgi:hypothetical protein